MTKQYKDKATRLGKMMNGNSKFGIPLVKCILECFEIVFSEEEVDCLLLIENKSCDEEALRRLWIPYFQERQKKDIAGKVTGETTKKDVLEIEDRFQKMFEELKRKGAIWQRRGEGQFELTPIFPGWIEIFSSAPVNETSKALIQKFAEFEELLIKLNIAPVRAYMNHVNTKNMATQEGRMSSVVSRGRKREGENKAGQQKRILNVGQKIDAEQTVYTSGEIMPLLEKHKAPGNLSVMNCFCRLKKQLNGGDCDYDMPMEACLVVGRLSRQLIETGVSRQITYEEAVRLIEECEDKGCIHTLYHYGITSEEEELIICNCCIDCCFLYGGYREGTLSQLLMKAYYRPEVIEDRKCIGCNKCNRYCPTDATWYDKKQQVLMYDYSKCIGCGQCVTQCPIDYRRLVRDERNVFVKTQKKK